jgi:salicylate hydroxylase
MRRGELINFVGIVEKQGWEVESWTQQGTVEECLQDFSGWHQDVRTLIESIEQHYKWALMVRDPIDNWTKGLVTLLGDAAHPTLPFLAQGAAMAIEDGHVLSRALQAYPDDTASALQAYQSARIERTSRIVLGSAENAARFHNPLLADAAGAQRYIDEQWQPKRVEERYGWLFEYRADEVNV